MNHTAHHRATILVRHRDPLVCAGLVAALCKHPPFEVLVGEDHAPWPEAPRIDVVIADYAYALRLTDPAVTAVRRPLASARILALTSHDREADIRRAIDAGVQGYLLRGGPLGELIEGVSAVARGARYLCRAVSQRMAESLTRVALTARETEVLRLVVRGESNKAIAKQLRVEAGTVKSHMTVIMDKLGAVSRMHAASIASERGLVDLAGGVFRSVVAAPRIVFRHTERDGRAKPGAMSRHPKAS